MHTLFLCILSVFFFTLSSQELRQTISVHELQSRGGLERSELSVLTKRFRGILDLTNAFEVIERKKMGEILKTQDFLIPDQYDTSKGAVQIG